ncbi:MAG: sigma-54 dependent transcriptional regulator [Candidatus Cloacimonetes bacterium]|nr:sigma-54 dependent transcriptional regulator [Candidatus Cloacimonadota bacterium]
MKQDKQKIKILVVDDDLDTLELFSEILSTKFDVITAASVSKAKEILSYTHFQIAITDLVMPKEDGLELIKHIKANIPYISIIVISGQATIQTALQAIKLGADEFILKPIHDFELLHLLIDKILKKQWLIEENKRMTKLIQKDFDRKMVIGSSYHIQSVIRLVQKIAPLETTVLITGETGVGKSLFAQLIHENSKQNKKSFVSLNCGSIPETLLESHLFGHKKGSFTDAYRDKIGYFQEAEGGTLFLDEITETSLAFQVKLLKVLETKMIRKVGDDKDIAVDVRLIIATNKDLSEQVKLGEFRKDLFYRLNVINIKIPPLRERESDIIELTKYFLKYFSEKYKKTGLKLSDSAMKILLSAKWDGNVRELRNVVEHSVILTEHSAILPDDLPKYISNIENSNDSKLFNLKSSFKEAKDNFEHQYFNNILKSCKGNITKMAEITGLKRQNLYPKLKQLGISIENYRK